MEVDDQYSTLADKDEMRKTILSYVGPEKASAFQDLEKQCQEHGLLDRPQLLVNTDISDGINDDCTLL